MRKLYALLVGTVFATVAGVPPAVISAHTSERDHVSLAAGAGHYLVGGSLDVQFAFFALQNEGRAFGAFHEKTNDGLGSVEFVASVTCLAVDPAQGRAWVGGVIVANFSTSPDFIGGVYQPGHDIWFRVLDGGEGPAEQDRKTFMGFEGAIPSSAAYCASRPWPDGNARTWPVTSGDIEVR